MIPRQGKKAHVGKTVAEVQTSNASDSLELCDVIVIVFTDGTRIRLAVDRYGEDYYISEVA